VNCRGHRLEHGKEAVASRVDFATIPPLQRTAHGGPVARQQRIPALVAQAHHVLRRADDVGEQEAEDGGRHVARFVGRPTHCA